MIYWSGLRPGRRNCFFRMELFSDFYIPGAARIDYGERLEAREADLG